MTQGQLKAGLKVPVTLSTCGFAFIVNHHIEFVSLVDWFALIVSHGFELMVLMDRLACTCCGKSLG
jgi:hypothetical protein